ncbi:Uncharacterised protein [Mycobacteroides abscessus subsp. abscessus]|nr:Uncharacterised protein [Mycobacteroides abscessus subsp. abscessus]
MGRADFVGFAGLAGLACRAAGLRTGLSPALSPRPRNRSRAESKVVGEYGTGGGSRRIRFIRSSRPARSAATASGSWRAALAIRPISRSVVAVAVPPAEMSGS